MTTIKSTFAKDADGWTIAGDVASFQWGQIGGQKGGYIYWVDAASGADSYWQAPAKFTGNLGAFSGGKLSFYWFDSGDNYQTGDVILTGANGTVLLADAQDPGTDWTHASVRMNPASWHLGTIEGEVVGKRAFAAVLEDVASLQIRAEHVNGAEDGGLDTVSLQSRAKPAASAADSFGADRHAALHGAVAEAHHLPDTSYLALV